MENVDRLMQQGVAEGVFPGAVVLAFRNGQRAWSGAYGKANIFTGEAVTRDTIFDLASLTKPLATTLAVMRLVERRQLALETTLGAVLPVFRPTDKAGITVADLLYHRSGLPDYKPYYKSLGALPRPKSMETLRELLVRERLTAPVGTQICYSDIGFMILQWMVEHLAAESLDRFVGREIYRPLGLDRPRSGLFFVDVTAGPPPGAYAATEQCPWRGVLLQGRVHDENAYAVGGVGGHAGLFGTAEGVYELLAALWDGFYRRTGEGILPPELIRRFLPPDPDVGRGLGFDAPTPPDSSCGRYFSTQTAGHLGFTGTSFWMDLQTGAGVVLLTNRVHPTRENIRIRSFRPLLHDAVMENLIKY